MGREKRGGYLIEWWLGDHLPKHVHVYKDGKEVAKIVLPDLKVLNGKMNKKLKKILMGLIKEGRI
jgi:hypothetical protein